MKNKKGIETILRTLILISLILCFISCSDSVSGFGAETTNGAVTISLVGDNNFDSCLVQIIPSNFNPLSDDIEAIEYRSYTTNSGVATFDDIKAGKYTLYCKNFISGKKSIIVDLQIDDDTLITSSLSNTGDIQVTFRNSENVIDTVNGCLLILGYPDYVKLKENISKVDSGYTVVFDSVPESIIRTLSYSSFSASSEIQNLSDSVPVFADDTTYVDAVLYYTFVNSSNSSFIPDSVSKFLYGSNGIRWLACDDELLKITEDSVYSITNKNSGIASGNILSIYEGKDRSIWIGTEQGVSNTKDNNTWITYSYESCGHNLKNVTSIVEDENALYIGTLGYGLYRFDGVSWQNYNKTGNYLPSDSITSLIIDSDGDLLGGSTYGIFNLIDTIIYTYVGAHSYFRSLHITSIAQDSAGDFWIGTKAGEILHLTDSLWFNYSMAVNCLSDNSITSIVCDKSGDVWAGSAEGRFYRYPKNSEFNGWLVYIGHEGILPGVAITSIDVSQNQVIYCSTEGGGMFILGASAIEVTSSWEHCY